MSAALTQFVPPAVLGFNPAAGPIYATDINPSGTLVAAVRSGIHEVFSFGPEDYPYSPLEVNGLLVGRRDDAILTTLHDKPYYDSTLFTVPRASFPESTANYYIAQPPHWITDNLLIQQIDVSQSNGDGTVPLVSNFVLLSVAEDGTVAEGAPFEIPVPDTGGNLNYGVGVFPQNVRPVGFINDRVYLIANRNHGTVSDWFLASFAVDGVAPIDPACVSLGAAYRLLVLGWWSDSLLIQKEISTSGAVSSRKLQALATDGTIEKTYELALDTTDFSGALEQRSIVAGTATGNRVVWRFDTYEDGENIQWVEVTRIDIETGDVAVPIRIGATMLDATSGASWAKPYVGAAYTSNPQRGVLYWGAAEDIYANLFTKSRAIVFDTSDTSALTIVSDFYVMEPSDLIVLEPIKDPAFGAAWGVFQMRQTSDAPWDYYWIDSPPPAVITLISPLLTGELLDTSQRYD